jgi:hypothetical protein
MMPMLQERYEPKVVEERKNLNLPREYYSADVRYNAKSKSKSKLYDSLDSYGFADVGHPL